MPSHTRHSASHDRPIAQGFPSTRLDKCESYSNQSAGSAARQADQGCVECNMRPCTRCSMHVNKTRQPVDVTCRRAVLSMSPAHSRGVFGVDFECCIPTVYVSKLSFKAQSGSLSSMQDHRIENEFSASRGYRAALQLGSGWMDNRWQTLCEVPVREYKCRKVWIDNAVMIMITKLASPA